MSSSKSLRGILVVLIVAVLAGCGFRPMHATFADGAVADELAQVYIAAIPDRVGQRLRNDLLDRMTPKGVPAKNAYRLEVNLTSTRPPTALSTSDLATRRNYSLTARFTLTSSDGKKRLMSGQYRALTSFDIVDSEYATLASHDYAEKLAAAQVADVIFTKVSLYFTSKR